MIRAWPRDVSLNGGSQLVLHVTGTDGPYYVRFYRAGARFEPAGGRLGPYRDPAVDFEIPPEWRPGAYVAHCFEGATPMLRSPDVRHGAALFVIRSAAARILVNLPLFTYHAYNVVENGGDCLYTGPTRVSLQRPGGGTGGRLWDEVNVDVYDRTSPRQSFAHWDAKGLSWLERASYEPAVCTDLDLHAGIVPSGVRLLLAFGHQEYWTEGMHRTVTRLLERGVNVAFFCGNTSWFRIRYDEEQRAIVRDGKWCDRKPEERLLGTSYRFGGGRWRGPRPPTGFTVRAASHWVFEGTGLRHGDTFGANERLIGYECDGPPDPAADCVLAHASLAAWRTDESGEVLGGVAGLLARSQGNGTVFNVATTDWARVLERDRVVERITANVIGRLTR
jgi:hypothetical protein